MFPQFPKLILGRRHWILMRNFRYTNKSLNFFEVCEFGDPWQPSFFHRRKNESQGKKDPFLIYWKLNWNFDAPSFPKLAEKLKFMVSLVSRGISKSVSLRRDRNHISRLTLTTKADGESRSRLLNSGHGLFSHFDIRLFTRVHFRLSKRPFQK